MRQPHATTIALRGAAIIAALTFTMSLTAGTAMGQETKCRDTILKEAGKYIKAQTKNLTKCNDSLLKAKSGFNGLQGRDCRDTAGKTQEKLDKAHDKFLAKIAKACGGDDKICNTQDDLDLDDPAIGWGGSGAFGNGFTGVCPDFESIGCTNFIRHCGGPDSDGEGITDCLVCINDEVVNQTMDLLYENLVPGKFGASVSPAKDHNKCQQAMVKASAKHVLAKSKILSKCWAALNKGKAGFGSGDLTGCTDSSGKTAEKIDKSESKKIKAICKKCGGDDKTCDQNISTIAGTLVNTAGGQSDDFDPLLDIGFGTSCPDVVLPYAPNTDCGEQDNLGSGSSNDVIENMEEFAGCLDCVLEFKVDCADRATVPNHEAMPPECNACVANTDGDPCPTTMEITANAFETRLDSGWTGLSHDFDIPSNGRLTVALSNCDGVTRPNCGVCDITGPISNGGGPKFDNQRCRSNNSTICSADSDCPASDNCVFYFGVNLPLSSGQVPICVSNEITGTVTGTVDIEGGTQAATMNLFSRVNVGVQNSRPCPNCVFVDGSQRFECTAGTRAGQECYVNSNSSIFGALSYDCPMNSSIGDLNITLQPATGLQTVTMSAATPNCTGSGFTNQKCFCSSCDNAANTPCFTNADCIAVGATICGGKRCLGGASNGLPCGASSDCAGFVPCGVPGTPTQPTQCVSGSCTAVPADLDSIDEGECATGPFDAICSIERFRGCATNANCNPPSAGGTCNDCVAGQTCEFVTRQCYTANGAIGNDVQVQGASDAGCGEVAHPKLGTLFCIPPTQGASVNAVAGLPGLGRLDLQVESRFE